MLAAEFLAQFDSPAQVVWNVVMAVVWGVAVVQAARAVDSRRAGWWTLVVVAGIGAFPGGWYLPLGGLAWFGFYRRRIERQPVQTHTE